MPLGWDDGYGARIGIMPRFGTDADVRWFDVDPCYVFHPMNAYVDGSQVVCDVGRHEYMWRGSMDDFAPCYLHRWTFDLDVGRGHASEQLDDVSHAFPRVDDRVVGLPPPVRLGGRAATGLDAAAMLDDARRDRQVRPRRPAAPSVVRPRPDTPIPASSSSSASRTRSGEDEGWAMGLVYDDTTDRSDLVILDATDPTAEPVATVHLPRRVPYGFHGSWISDAELPADDPRSASAPARGSRAAAATLA